MFSWSPNEEIMYILNVVKKFLKFSEARLFLDIGCGTGRIARGIRDLGFEILCLDISSEMCVYAYNKRDLDVLQGDMLNIPLKKGLIDVAYSMLATINHVDSLRSLEKHFIEVFHVLKENGMYIFDFVVNFPDCIGICDEWSSIYKNSNCRALHIIEAIENEYYVESLELVCENGVHYKSRSKLYLPKHVTLKVVTRNIGFKHMIFLKPFTFQKLNNPRGRVFTVLIK